MEKNILLLIATSFLLTLSQAHSKECIPENWEYDWSRVGGVWFTHINGSGTWYEMEAACEKVEPGRTSMATVRSDNEKNHFVRKHIANGYYWIAGLRVADNWWYWYTKNSTLERMAKMYWNKGQPDDDNHRENCIMIFKAVGAGWDGLWNDYCCWYKFPAFCELRCQ